MNGLFQIACRTLAMGLFAAVCLVFAVVTQGVHPENLVAFRSRRATNESEPVQLANTSESSPSNRRKMPERIDIARVEPKTRIDSHGTAESAQTKSKHLTPYRPKIDKQRAADESFPDRSTENDMAGASRRLPPPADELNLSELDPKSVSASVEDKFDSQSLDSLPRTATLIHENTKQFIVRLAEIQAQLETIANQRVADSNRTDKESTQRLFEQNGRVLQRLRRLELKLDALKNGISQRQEQSAAELPGHTNSKKEGSSATASLSKEPPNNFRNAPQNELEPSIGKPGAAVPFALNLRDLLELQKSYAGSNLMLAVQVDGDVEINLEKVPLEEAGRVIDAFRKSTESILNRPMGSVIEDGEAENSPDVRSGHHYQTSPHTYQRQVFLPPIIKSADSPVPSRPLP